MLWGMNPAPQPLPAKELAYVMRLLRAYQAQNGCRLQKTHPSDDEARDDKGRWTDEPPPTVEANIARGRAAMAHVLATHKDAHHAMHRADLGWIDFVWGSEGEPPKGAKGKRKGAKGVAHIIEARMRKDGVTQDEATHLATKMTEVIGCGTALKPTRYKDEKSGKEGTRVEVLFDKHSAILMKDDGQNAYLITGYEIYGAGGTDNGGAKISPTLIGATLTRPDEGAASPLYAADKKPSLKKSHAPRLVLYLSNPDEIWALFPHTPLRPIT
jgi:hypothetical protein